MVGLGLLYCVGVELPFPNMDLLHFRCCEKSSYGRRLDDTLTNTCNIDVAEWCFVQDSVVAIWCPYNQ